MDITDRIGSRLTATVLSVAAGIVLMGPVSEARTQRATVEIHGGDQTQVQTIEWAQRRYRAAGLEGMPSLDIYLHATDAGCRGNLGFHKDGRIDLCTAESSEPYARKTALHEMAHAWTDANVSAETREAFLGLRGLSAWNDWDLPWKERGTEAAAEVVAWGLGEDGIRPLMLGAVETPDLIAAYELLTGRAPITPEA
jgi:hypothetical protein